jgi:molybdate transport system permease protein
LFNRISWALSFIGLAFLTVPIVALVLRVIQGQGWLMPPAEAIGQALLLSVVTTAISLALTVIFGTPLAYTLARRNFRGRRVLRLFVELPIVLPPAVAGLALLITFGRRGLLGAPLDDLGIRITFTAVAVIMAQVFVAAPFYIRSAIAGFERMPQELIDAARSDGAGEWAVLWAIILPIASRSLVAGAILSWARALGEFGATLLFAGNLTGRTQTLPLLIYGLFERDIDAAIIVGVVLIAVALVALAVASWLTRHQEDGAPAI